MVSVRSTHLGFAHRKFLSHFTGRDEGQGLGGGSRRAGAKFWLACLQRVGSLEKEMAHMKTWNTEKERCELKDVGYRSLACVVKEDRLSGEG